MAKYPKARPIHKIFLKLFALIPHKSRIFHSNLRISYRVTFFWLPYLMVILFFRTMAEISWRMKPRDTSNKSDHTCMHFSRLPMQNRSKIHSLPWQTELNIPPQTINNSKIHLFSKKLWFRIFSYLLQWGTENDERLIAPQPMLPEFPICFPETWKEDLAKKPWNEHTGGGWLKILDFSPIEIGL